MKAERTMPRTAGSPRARRAWGANTLRGTLLLRWRSPGTLAKDRDRHPLKAPCLHLSQNRYFDCQKTKGAGFKPPREAARSFNSREFCFEIWERESAPADYRLIRRLSMDASCPSLPPKILVADKLRPNVRSEEHTSELQSQSNLVCRLLLE